jgi:hypothetical protein
MTSRSAYWRTSRGKGAVPICTSPSSPITARNAWLDVVLTCVGPRESGRSDAASAGASRLPHDLDELYCCGRRAAPVTVDHDELGPARYI